MATAKHRAIDLFRHGKLIERKHAELGHELLARQESPERDLDAAIDDHVGDDLLGLMFTTCHPVLSTEARVALTLRLLGGLTTEEIARAFLVPVPTMAQRLVRAKQKIRAAGSRSVLLTERGSSFGFWPRACAIGSTGCMTSRGRVRRGRSPTIRSSR
jgi:predicted RNA polymerase sigma factor